jgi:hypothetical protein
MKIIDTICLNVDVSGITQGKEFELTPVIYDKNGDVVRTDRLSIHGQMIKGTINTLNTKEVPLTINLKPEDVLTQSLIKSYVADIDYITIAATDDQLASIDSLTIEIPTTISESQAATENFSKNVKLKDYAVPEGIYIVDESVSTNIAIEYNDQVKRVIEVPASSVRLTNARSTYKYTNQSEPIKITVSGARTDVLALDASKLLLTADVRNFYTGTKTVEVSFKAVSGITFEKVYMKVDIAYK